ncbi:hypothetical protein [Tateyamaria pelophila]|uniref:hypothetical protein n=1 Tax=Tateyamaria pelophila TaxID=328415 RepID=UPI001CC07E6E|nr:hypothetical protein [Tateyamaria pelophila]
MTIDPEKHATDRLDAECRANDRKSGRTPPIVEQINKTKGLLRKAIRRAGLPPSLCRQAAGMVGYYAHKRMSNFHTVYPGMKRMAEWGDCTERQARRNFAQLEAGRVIWRVGAEKGGRRLATEWIIDFGGLKKWLILIGANPSPMLLGLLESILIGGAPYPKAQPENPDMVGGEIDPETRTPNPDINPDTMSARSIVNGNRRNGASSVAPAKRRRGG